MSDASADDSVVRLSGVGFDYGAHPALRDVSLALRPGVTGLVGVNGAGKSTLIRLLSTTSVPTYGEVRLFGQVQPSRRPGALRRRIGFMPQSLDIPRDLRVADFLAYLAWMREVPRRRRGAEIGRVLEVVGLDARGRSRVGSLSGGMHRRLLLAQALLADPDLLLLDEPTAGLDPEQRIRLRELIASSAAGRTTVVSSHQLEDLVPIVDRLVMLDEGTVVFDGTPAELARIGEEELGAAANLSSHEVGFLALRSRGEQA